MNAFNNDSKLKRDLLKEVAWHREHDMLVKGTYGAENGHWKGCAVGCSIHSLNKIRGIDRPTGNHKVYEEIGIPTSLAYLQDGLFEGMNDDDSQAWPERFWKAINVAADLRFVYGKWFAWTLLDEEIGFWKVWKEMEDQEAFKAFGKFVAYLADDKPFKKYEWDAARKPFLARLDSLASLDRLASLASHASHASLASHARLARLDRLASLDRLARLDRLDRLDRLGGLDLYKRSADKLISLLEQTK